MAILAAPATTKAGATPPSFILSTWGLSATACTVVTTFLTAKTGDWGKLSLIFSKLFLVCSTISVIPDDAAEATFSGILPAELPPAPVPLSVGPDPPSPGPSSASPSDSGSGFTGGSAGSAGGSWGGMGWSQLSPKHKSQTSPKPSPSLST